MQQPPTTTTTTTTTTTGITANNLWLFTACCCLLLASTVLQAEPADWYQWQSRLTQKIICKQTDPGEGWQKHDGPFLDAGCRQRKMNNTKGR